MQIHHRAAAVLVAGLATATLSLPAWAQDDARDAAARCRALPTDAERLDCMERLVFDLAPPAAAAESPAPAAMETPATPPAPPAAAAAIEANPESAADGRRGWLPRLPFTGQSDEAEPVAAMTASREPESYGAERLEARDDERSRPEPLMARVVGFEEVFYQRLRVELDNGQVWEQRENAPPWREEQYGAPEEVEIVPSRFGGYRMRLVGKNLTLGVERVR